MGKKVLIFFVFIILTSCRSVEKYNTQISAQHRIVDLRDDIDKLHNQLKKHHPLLYQYISKTELDFKIDSLKKSINKPITSREFYKKTAPVIANIRQGHISISSGSKQFTKNEYKNLKKRKLHLYDLDFEYLNNKLWVVNAKGKDSVLIGNEVLKVEDEFTSDLIKTYKTRFTSDGFNTTLYNRAVGRYFTSFYYKDKGFLDSLNITFKKQDSTFVKLFKRISKKGIKKDSLKTKKKKKLSVDKKRSIRITNRNKKRENKKRGYIAKRKEYYRNFNFIGKDSSVAYFKIRGFRNGNFRRFYRESFTKIDSAESKHLVLDLRDNGGGRVSEIDYLYSYLTDKKYQFMEASEVNSRTFFLKYLMSNTTPISLKMVSAILSPVIAAHNVIKTKKKGDRFYYKLKYSKYRKPKSLNFKGNIYVLINGNSFSASSLISTKLKTQRNVVFVGEETGGAYNGCVAGIYKLYELPNSKLKIRIGLMQMEAPNKQKPDGYGVKPDIEIMSTIENQILNQDVELDYVLDDIYKEK